MHLERSFTWVRVGDFDVVLGGEDVLNVGGDGPFDRSLADVLERGWDGGSRVLRVRTKHGERGFRVPASLSLIEGLRMPVPAYLTSAARRGRWKGILQLPGDARAGAYALLIDLDEVFDSPSRGDAAQ